MTNKIRIGVIGCGAIAQIMHIPHIVEYDERFELAALCDAHRPVLDAVADRYGVAARYTDWRALLALDDIDAVVICHAGSHRDSVIAALDANKHVLVEKPLGWNVDDVKAVVTRANKSDRIVQMAYHKRYDPAFAFMQEKISAMKDLAYARVSVYHPANELGFSPHRIRRGNGVIEEGHIDPGTIESQRIAQLEAFAGGALAPLVDVALGARKNDDRLRLGYGIITISLIHQIYSLFGLLGPPERVVSTEIWRDGFSISAIVAYPGELRCAIDWHQLNNLKDYREEYAFYGNHDRAFLTLASPYFKNFPSPVRIQGGDADLSWEKTITVSHGEAFVNELLAFHDCVVNNKTPLTTVNDALEHIKLCQALIDAAV